VTNSRGTSSPDNARSPRRDAEKGYVLVTGGSGYLASWTIVDLLRRGYHVRTTVRSLSREPEVRSMVSKETPTDDRLSFVEANLLAESGWEQAAEGADYVLHVASPMPVGEFRGTDLIGPAVDGTLRVLRAARTANVRRVVVTSSGNAALPNPSSGQVADESVWTEVPDTPAYAYTRSKVIAEREAWSFAHANGLELTTVLPAFMQGPVLGQDYSGSVDVVARMLTGRIPAMPRVGFNIVDVRDIADLHVRAMTNPGAAGQRFLGAGDFLWMSDIAAILRERLGERARKVPRRMLPDLIVRLGALVNDDMKQIAPQLNVQQRVSAAQATRLLGWRARPAITAILDGAASLIGNHLV
jgi:nucleoside-diphosphate-sugar epimerase